MIASPESLDFTLEIGHALAEGYPLAVLDSPAGETRQTMAFPFDEVELHNRVHELTTTLMRGAGGLQPVSAQEERAVREFGTDLFEAVFAGKVGRLFDLSRARARRQGATLRLKLRCRAPELAALPWEFLYDPSDREYLCLSRQTPLVRYLGCPTPVAPLRVRLPLRILGVLASPRDLPALDVAREQQRMDEALAPLVASGMVVVSWLPEATRRALQQALQQDEWHVLHFIGHGELNEQTGQGVLAFCAEDGNADLLGAAQVGRLLGDHPSLRLTVLNGCEGGHSGTANVFSSTAAELVRRGTPGVVAMQYMITDAAGIEFSRSFYDALTIGLPVDLALAEARKALCLGLSGSLEWGAPVLFMRAPDGVLFDMVAPAPASVPVSNDTGLRPIAATGPSRRWWHQLTDLFGRGRGAGLPVSAGSTPQPGLAAVA